MWALVRRLPLGTRPLENLRLPTVQELRALTNVPLPPGLGQPLPSTTMRVTTTLLVFRIAKGDELTFQEQFGVQKHATTTINWECPVCKEHFKLTGTDKAHRERTKHVARNCLMLALTVKSSSRIGKKLGAPVSWGLGLKKMLLLEPSKCRG